MKLGFRDIEGFVTRPDPTARIVLVYGPDQGLVGERLKLIAQTQVADLSDPFNVSWLTGEQCISDPAKLNDEAFAGSLMGGDRVVIIKEAGDSLTPILKDYLAEPSNDTLVVVEAGELSTKSSLRLMIEKAKNAAAVPCYVEDERDLTRLIQNETQKAGFAIERDALTMLANALVGDRKVARSELEKLLLYKMSDGNKTITSADVAACSGDVRARTFDELIHAVGGGDVNKMSSSLATLTQENTPSVAILRSLQNHFRRLYQAHLNISEKNMDAKAALKALQPPVFFKFESVFLMQLKRWPMKRIERALVMLAETESLTKQTGTPVETLTAHTLLAITLQKAA